MAVFKCKMCGASLSVTEGVKIVECDFCGTSQTVPSVSDEGLQNLFNRANAMRIKGEFDKAEKTYEKIIQADGAQAEAYWGLILCKYGIEYVEDPKTYRRVPTCHRASYDAVVSDENYKMAIRYADGAQRAVYEREAAAIDEIQKGILAQAQKEEPYDVFICYKETDESGKRTQDSVIANDIYYQLTEAGYKVFYAAITLEDKLGKEYEPIIFAALHSAKVMLAIGTKAEYFNAVWVKNEWSRFLKIMKNDRNKLLIPCYRNMDAYDLPEEFAHLQAQDMGKIGFINDLVRGVSKVVSRKSVGAERAAAKSVDATAVGANAQALIKRMFIFLEDGEWQSADEYAEKALDAEPELALPYVGKLMSSLKVRRQAELAEQRAPLDGDKNYQKAYRYADEKLKETLAGYNNAIRERVLTLEKNNLYDVIIVLLHRNTLQTLDRAEEKLQELGDWKDSLELLNEIPRRREKLKREIAEREEKRKIAAAKRRKRNLIVCVAVVILAVIIAVIVGISADVAKKKKAADLKARGYCEMELSFDESYYIVTGVEDVNCTEIIIPSEYKGKPVKEIGDNAFYECSSLTSVEIGDGVTSIGGNAFDGCRSLTNIDIPDSVTSIGKSAFYNCTSLKGVYISDVAAWCDIMFLNDTANPLCYAKNLYLDSKHLTALVIPNRVTNISDYAFYNCDSLTSIEIPDSVTNISDYAFYNCSGLTSITIPDGVTSIGERAFQLCSGLTEITLPFVGKTSSSTGGNAKLSVIFGGNIPTSLKKVTVTGGVIADEAFYQCSSLTSVVIGDNVTKIGNNAFNACSGLAEITIPKNMEYIGRSAFYNCSGLTSLTFEDTSTWYNVDNNADWENKTNGMAVSVLNASTNATNFTSVYGYYSYYWYKK